MRKMFTAGIWECNTAKKINFDVPHGNHTFDEGADFISSLRRCPLCTEGPAIKAEPDPPSEDGLGVLFS